jgi:replicative DNA helicase
MTGPHDTELERELLGALMINNDAFERVEGWLGPCHFRERLHGEIFDAIAWLIGRDDEVATPTTVKRLFPPDMMVAPEMPIARYLAICAANAVLPIENVTGHAIRIVGQGGRRTT